MRDTTAMGIPIPENSVPMAKIKGGLTAAIGLGGMAGVMKVRNDVTDEQLARGDDVGWYDPPEGTRARRATDAELRRDGVKP